MADTPRAPKPTATNGNHAQLLEEMIRGEQPTLHANTRKTFIENGWIDAETGRITNAGRQAYATSKFVGELADMTPPPTPAKPPTPRETPVTVRTPSGRNGAPRPTVTAPADAAAPVVAESADDILARALAARIDEVGPDAVWESLTAAGMEPEKATAHVERAMSFVTTENPADPLPEGTPRVDAPKDPDAPRTERPSRAERVTAANRFDVKSYLTPEEQAQYERLTNKSFKDTYGTDWGEVRRLRSVAKERYDAGGVGRPAPEVRRPTPTPRDISWRDALAETPEGQQALADYDRGYREVVQYDYGVDEAGRPLNDVRRTEFPRGSSQEPQPILDADGNPVTVRKALTDAERQNIVRMGENRARGQAVYDVPVTERGTREVTELVDQQLRSRGVDTGAGKNPLPVPPSERRIVVRPQDVGGSPPVTAEAPAAPPTPTAPASAQATRAPGYGNWGSMAEGTQEGIAARNAVRSRLGIVSPGEAPAMSSPVYDLTGTSDLPPRAPQLDFEFPRPQAYRSPLVTATSEPIPVAGGVPGWQSRLGPSVGEQLGGQLGAPAVSSQVPEVAARRAAARAGVGGGTRVPTSVTAPNQTGAVGPSSLSPPAGDLVLRNAAGETLNMGQTPLVGSPNPVIPLDSMGNVAPVPDGPVPRAPMEPPAPNPTVPPDPTKYIDPATDKPLSLTLTNAEELALQQQAAREAAFTKMGVARGPGQSLSPLTARSPFQQMADQSLVETGTPVSIRGAGRSPVTATGGAGAGVPPVDLVPAAAAGGESGGALGLGARLKSLGTPAAEYAAKDMGKFAAAKSGLGFALGKTWLPSLALTAVGTGIGMTNQTDKPGWDIADIGQAASGAGLWSGLGAMAGGALAGAAGGSAISPGLGTAIGFIGGAIIGGLKAALGGGAKDPKDVVTSASHQMAKQARLYGIPWDQTDSQQIVSDYQTNIRALGMTPEQSLAAVQQDLSTKIAQWKAGQDGSSTQFSAKDLLALQKMYADSVNQSFEPYRQSVDAANWMTNQYYQQNPSSLNPMLTTQMAQENAALMRTAHANQVASLMAPQKQYLDWQMQQIQAGQQALASGLSGTGSGQQLDLSMLPGLTSQPAA